MISSNSFLKKSHNFYKKYFYNTYVKNPKRDKNKSYKFIKLL